MSADLEDGEIRNQQVARQLSADLQQPIELLWKGPFAWPGFEAESSLPGLPPTAGVYLQTVEYQQGFAVYAAGITRRPAAKRFREHTRKYLNGEYTVLDIEATAQGQRKEVWHGWGYARAHRDEFEARKQAIQDAARRQMAAHRLFLADPEELVPGRRLRERLEAAVMDCLYAQPTPLCDLPDRGMFLSRRRPNEPLALVRNLCNSRLHGLSELISL